MDKPPPYINPMPPSYPAGGPVPVVAFQKPRIHVGTEPCQCVCPNCNSEILTSTQKAPGMMAWIISGALCFFGCCLCVCIPCCIPSLQDVTHTCPNCNVLIGKYRPG